jgi:hypothetical protein
LSLTAPEAEVAHERRMVNGYTGFDCGSDSEDELLRSLGPHLGHLGAGHACASDALSRSNIDTWDESTEDLVGYFVTGHRRWWPWRWVRMRRRLAAFASFVGILRYVRAKRALDTLRSRAGHTMSVCSVSTCRYCVAGDRLWR